MKHRQIISNKTIKQSILKCEKFYICEELCLLEYKAVYPLKVNPHFGGIYRVHLQGPGTIHARNKAKIFSKNGSAFRGSNQLSANNQAMLATRFMLVSCLVSSSNIKTETTCSLETCLDYQRTTRRYIPEDNTIHKHRCEKL
jgi:hypothetical protein